MHSTRTASLAALLILAVLGMAGTAPVATASPALPPDGERFVFRWELKKLAALFGGILIPGEGRGMLTFEPDGDERMLAELLITSEHSDEGEFWRYGAEIDSSDGQTLRAWSAYRWRGEQESESAEIDEKGVIDVASGIWQIRQELPDEPTDMRIWSDGKIYPVVVVPRGVEARRLPGGRRVEARHFRVEGRDVEGERHWKGHMDLWFALDAEATPVEIHFDRTLVGVRLRLVESVRPGAGTMPGS